MDKEQVIAWAREAGFEQLAPDIEDWVCFTEEIERFAALVAAAERERVLPKEAPPGLLMSMAIRYDHGLGLPGYYDMLGKVCKGVTHAQKLESALTIARQLYEEVSGHGFYSPEKEAEYAAIGARGQE